MNAAEVKLLAEKYFEEVRSYRRYLHMHPEISFHEHATAAYVQQQLTALGLEVRPGIAGTGLTAMVKGRGDSKQTIALRADMDALPIHETNDVPYRSVNEGVMHACGHDAHTACLLGAAHILQETRDQWSGNIQLIFQPGEEKLPGGASKMIAEGVLKNPPVQAILGQHVYTPFEVGTVAFCPGKMMASTDELYITVKGKGGHGAYPGATLDPVPVVAQIITALQLLVSRFHSPIEPIVLTIGKVIAEGATNIIPDQVYMEGTLRTFNESLRKTLQEEIYRTCTGIAKALRVEAEVDIRVGYHCLHNDETLTHRAIVRAKDYLGAENVLLAEPRMGAEDFAFYSHEVPACFYRLGTGNPAKGIDAFIHTPQFNIYEDALKIGMGLLAWNAIREADTAL